MIQDIRGVFDNTFRQETARPEDRVLCLREDAVLAAETDGALTFPTAAEAARVGAYLFSVGGVRYFEGDAAGEAFTPFGAAALRRCASREEVFAGITGLHLLRWYRDRRFCGRCGAEMKRSETERAMVCACGNVEYPKICPAVIVGVLHDGKICLTKYNRGYAHWALVAGFAEIGETVEQTVAREVREETGLRVKNLRYYKSQPWGLSSSLLFGFFCEVDGDPEIRVDGMELKEGRWFSPAEIDFEDDSFSLTREMILAFRSGNAAAVC